MVSPEFLHPGDRVLIIDDFLATGQTIAAMARIVETADGSVVGIGTLVEKSFEGGARCLRIWTCPLSLWSSSMRCATMGPSSLVSRRADVTT